MAALISHRAAQAIVACENGRVITVSQYLASVSHMASRLPHSGHVLNLCSNRYHFAVVLGAALVRGQPVLLPSTRSTEMLQQLGRQYAALHAVLDAPGESAGLPQISFEAAPGSIAEFTVPDIDPQQVAAHVFTSGSTGQPVAHVKHWGPLVQNARAAGQRIRAWLAHAPALPFTVTGTVPPQHMYGFESTVLLPLLNDGILDASHPFYPADIAAALQNSTAPRVLVSTPFHLRTLLEAQVSTPDLALILSATAPLTPQLARQAEETLGAPLLEIYGSTETGQIATRHTSAGETWETYEGIEVQAVPGTGESPSFLARGGHVEGEIILSDVLELHSATRFTLLGRHADLVNIAGKRTSLAYLNHQLGSIPGVQDAAVFWPQNAKLDEQARIQRPVAFVVAPGLSEQALAQALRERIDPAFMPRPIHFVASLPRNATGKLPQQTLAELALACAGPELD